MDTAHQEMFYENDTIFGLSFISWLLKVKYKMNRIGFENCWISDSLKRNKIFWNNDKLSHQTLRQM